MKIATRILIFSFFLILYVFIYLFTTKHKEEQIDFALQRQLQYLDHSYNVSTNGFKNVSDTLYGVITSRPEILELLYKAKHAQTETERVLLRKELYKMTRPYFEQSIQAGLKIMLFTFEDNRCFLRVHKPSKFGDDLSSVRYSFTYVNDKKKMIRGFEQGKISHAFRNIYPIYKGEEYLGSVDFGFSSEILQEDMTRLHRIDTHFILNKTLFDVKVWQAQEKVNYIQAIEHKDFLFALTPSQSDNAFSADKIKINEAMREDIYQNIKHGGPFALFYHDERVRIVSFFPIENIKEKKTVAYLVSYAESYYIEGVLREYKWINTLCLIGLFLLAFIITSNVEQRSYLQERVKEEVEKNKQQQQSMLVQSRMAQMGEMIAMIAHQWRQPLATISAISGTMQVNIAMDKYEEVFFEEQLEKISELTQHLSKTIDDFRRFFSEEKKEVFETLENIVEGSLDIVRPLINNKGIKITTDYQCNEELLVYPNELKQVVLNLIKNAQEVIVEKKIENPKIEIKTYIDDMKYYLQIQDNAGGIPEDIIEKIFEPYFTTKGELNGTGLGLYMSYLIINEHHNGRITVHNKDEGACFIIELCKKRTMCRK